MKTLAALIPLLLLAMQGADRLTPAPDWLAGAAGASPTPATQGAPCVDCNVVLISIDTLRPDHLGCYGYERPTSPRIDAFCEESVVFEQALAHAPSTLPSHASIFTSLIPPHHGAKSSTRTPLSDDLLTMAELLTASGWTSAAFTDGGQMSPRWNLGQGFELYETQRGSAYLMNRFRERVDHAIDWLESARTGRFFLFLHTYEVHHPYTPEAKALRTRRWKLFGGRLFDVWSDPAEQADLAAGYPGLTAALTRRLADLIAAKAAPDTESIELDQELREQLRSLGYIQ